MEAPEPQTPPRPEETSAGAKCRVNSQRTASPACPLRRGTRHLPSNLPGSPCVPFHSGKRLQAGFCEASTTCRVGSQLHGGRRGTRRRIIRQPAVSWVASTTAAIRGRGQSSRSLRWFAWRFAVQPVQTSADFRLQAAAAATALRPLGVAGRVAPGARKPWDRERGCAAGSRAYPGMALQVPSKFGSAFRSCSARMAGAGASEATPARQHRASTCASRASRHGTSAGGPAARVPACELPDCAQAAQRRQTAEGPH